MKRKALLVATLCLGGLLVATQTVNAEGGNSTTKGKIKFVDGTGGDKTDPTDPGDKKDPDDKTDPKDPVKPVDPGEKTDGPLKFVYVPGLDFGDNNVIKTTGKAHYYAKFAKVNGDKERPNFFEVNDSRGGGKGWTVSLSNSGVFKNKEDHEIKANLYVNDLNIRSNSQLEDKYYPSVTTTLAETVNGKSYMRIGSGSVLVNADPAQKQGFGSWTVRFGTTGNTVDQKVDGDKVEKRNPAIVLEVLPGMKDSSSAYTTDLVWQLSDVK